MAMAVMRWTNLLICLDHHPKCLNSSKKEIEEEDKDEKVKGTLLTT